MDVYGDSGKMGRSESDILCPSVPTAARDGASAYPGSGAAPESHDAVVFPDPGAPPAAATNGGVACPDALAATLTTALPPATRNAVHYTDWLTAQLGPGAAPAAATNGVAYPDAVAATLTTGLPPATRNAVHYTDRLTVQLSQGAAAPSPRNGAAFPGAVLMPQLSPDAAAPTPRNGAAYPGVVPMPQLSSGAAAPTPRDAVAYPDVLVPQLSPGAAAPIPRNALAYPDVLVEHVGSTMAPATWNSVAYPGSGAPEAAVNGMAFPGGRFNAVTTATENTVGYAIDVHDGGGYDERSGTALPFAAQAVDATDRDVLLADAGVPQVEVEVPRAAAERARGGLGLAATALAVAGLTAGGAATPATAMALFAMLVAGVTLVTVRVFRV